jgi:hypothetical protein
MPYFAISRRKINTWIRFDFPEAFEPMRILNESGWNDIVRKLLKFVTEMQVIGI